MLNPLITFSSKDLPFFFIEQLDKFSFIPFVWDPARGNGFGENLVHVLWLRTYTYATSWIFHNTLNLDWQGITILFFFLPFLLIGFFSIRFFIKTIFQSNRPLWILAVIIYLFNTYILMLVNGGQVGIVLAYAVAPLVLARFIKIIQNPIAHNDILTGLVLSSQILFDLRIAYITIGIATLYFSFHHLFVQKLKIKLITYHLFLSTLITVGLHAFWIIPLLFVKNTVLAPAISGVGGVEFFSFATFSNTISLLHPNWPENIFGKVYFMKPEFLIIPILAYSTLFFVRNNRRILFFALLGLIGAFLAKGTNPPFGEIYLWLFDHFPGFLMFRDSTKWYLLVALSYSVLIPLSIFSIYEWLKSQDKSLIKSKIFNTKNLFLLSIISYLLFLVRPLWLGQLGGTFKLHEIPKEYIELKDFLDNRPVFFRTLWIPQRQRFGYYSNLHPAVEANELFKISSPSAVVSILQEEFLRSLGVRYIILPFDSQGELFLDDRRYSQKIRDEYEKNMDKITWLQKKSQFARIAVYELNGSNDLFKLTKSESKLNWQMIDSTKYTVNVPELVGRDTLIFSQRFDPHWVARSGETQAKAVKIDLYHMGFEVFSKGMYTIEYTPQKYAYYGYGISFLVLSANLIVLVKIRRKK